MTVKRFLASELTNEMYHSDTSKLTGSAFPHLSSSGMKTLIESPQKYNEIYIQGFQSVGNTTALDVGSYTHAVILEPHTVERDFVIWNGARRAGREWEDFRIQHADKTIITERDKAQVDMMVAAFHKSKHGPALIDHSKGMAEVSFLADFDNIPVKCRADFLRTVPVPGDPNPGAAIIDIKTSSSPLTDDEIANVIFKYSYELSCALYCDILKKYDGLEHSFYLVFLSKYGNGGCRTWRASEKMLELGRTKYRRALEIYKDSLLYGFDERGEPATIPTICPPLHLYGASYGK
jgi:hypothetical protein